MHTIQIHINENISSREIGRLKNYLMQIPHITDVEMCQREPHDILVEYEEHRGVMPMDIVNSIKKMGYHTDVISA